MVAKTNYDNTPARVAQPIEQPVDDRALAPWPLIDRSPIVIGPGLSLTYVSSIFRLSLSGYRAEYVDLLDELLEKDPHTFSRVQSRVLVVADARIACTPPVLPADAPKSDVKLAEKIALHAESALRAIPLFRQHLVDLGWALYYAIVGLEVHWGVERDGSWVPRRLSLVHSRRLSYPASGSWDLYVWDQGPVLPWQWFGQAPTNRVGAGPNGLSFGLRVADYPGKFIVHAPKLRGDYPTREGLGRQIAYWMVLKLIAARGAPQYLEKFAKPWPEAIYRTSNAAEPRAANDKDVEDAKVALRAMGAGTLASWVHSDAVELKLGGTADSTRPKITFREWIEVCDQQISEAVSGGTLTSQVTKGGGNRALGEVHERGELRLSRYDGSAIADVLRRDLVAWFVKLNYPGKEYLTPLVDLHVEPDPSPGEIIDRASKAAAAGIPVDADKVADEAGIPVIAAGDEKGRRMVPLKMVDPGAFDPDYLARMRAERPEDVAAAAAAKNAGTPPGDAVQGEQDGGASSDGEEDGDKTELTSEEDADEEKD